MVFSEIITFVESNLNHSASKSSGSATKRAVLKVKVFDVLQKKLIASTKYCI